MDAGRRARAAAAERAVVDPGACRDLVGSLAEGVAAARRRGAPARVPGAEVVVQLDEPSLPAVLTGALPTASGFGRLRAVEEPVVAAGVETVLEAASGAGAVATVVHCCAADPPVDVLVHTGAGASRSTSPASAGRPGRPWRRGRAAGRPLGRGRADRRRPALGRGGRRRRLVALAALGLDLALLAGVVLTPACGLAASTPADARARWPAPCRRRPRWRTGRADAA